MPPLFEEANRTRALLADIARRLAARGLAALRPELPGQGESLVPTLHARLDHMRAAVGAAVAAEGDGAVILAVRGGALLDADLPAPLRLHVDPVPGAALVRDLLRTRLAVGAPVEDPREPGAPMVLAGNLVDRALLAALMAAEPRPPTAAIHHRDLAPGAAPPWRRAEPDRDASLATALSDWVVRCAG